MAVIETSAWHGTAPALAPQCLARGNVWKSSLYHFSVKQDILCNIFIVAAIWRYAYTIRFLLTFFSVALELFSHFAPTLSDRRNEHFSRWQRTKWEKKSSETEKYLFWNANDGRGICCAALSTDTPFSQPNVRHTLKHTHIHIYSGDVCEATVCIFYDVAK